MWLILATGQETKIKESPKSQLLDKITLCFSLKLCHPSRKSSDGTEQMDHEVDKGGNPECLDQTDHLLEAGAGKTLPLVNSSICLQWPHYPTLIQRHLALPHKWWWGPSKGTGEANSSPQKESSNPGPREGEHLEKKCEHFFPGQDLVLACEEGWVQGLLPYGCGWRRAGLLTSWQRVPAVCTCAHTHFPTPTSFWKLFLKASFTD